LGALKNLFKRKLQKISLRKNNNENTHCASIPNSALIKQDLTINQPERRKNIFNYACSALRASLTKTLQFCYNIIFKMQKFFLIPDDKILWAIPSFFSALRIIKTEKPDLIFVTIPPYSSFILAALLKKWTDIKLIVDYRDPWNIPNTNNNFLNFKLEKWTLKNCDGITYVVPKIIEILKNNFELNKIKSELIYNGYDEDDYKDIEPVEFDKWTMISGGDLYGEENVFFFKILEEFMFENPNIKNNFQLIICSNYHQWFEDYLKNSPIKENIINLGVLPKKDYLKYVKGADAACIFSYAYYQNINYQVQMHGRVFDYLYFNKKLLIIGHKHNNMLYDILNKNEFSFIFGNKSDINEIKLLLRQIYFNIKKDQIQNSRLNKFSRSELTNSLTELFKAGT